jgi:hypothetical protein
MSSSVPRRSARIAAKAVGGPVTVVEPAPPKEAKPSAPATFSLNLKGRPSRQRLLEAAEALRLACTNAHTKEDWAACREFAHKLDDAAERSEEGEAIFITDCAWWCNCDAVDRRAYAIASIDSYIESLE